MIDQALKVEACLHDCIKTVEELFAENQKLRRILVERGCSEDEIERTLANRRPCGYGPGDCSSNNCDGCGENPRREEA